MGEAIVRASTLLRIFKYFFLFQGDILYVGRANLNLSTIGPENGQGLLKALVPGTPDCRAIPVGDGIVGQDGGNCPFQMYTLSGSFAVTKGGSYTFCTTSTEGSANAFFVNKQSLPCYLTVWLHTRSNLYVDGVLVVNNDYAQTTATQRCGSAVLITSGLHILYVEGWARGSGLSLSATYQGPDTSMLRSPISSALTPRAVPVNVSAFLECDPEQSNVQDGIFTLCGFGADNYTYLESVEDIFFYYMQATQRI